MLTALIWTLAALVALVVTFLALPVRLRIVAGTLPAPRLRLRLKLLGGLVPAIPVVDSARKSARKPEPASPPALRKPPREPGTRRRLRLRRLRGVPELASAILGVFRLRHLRIDADFGLGDPAETGIAYGILAPFLHSGPAAATSLSLRPDFTDARLSGSLDAEIGLVPLRLLPPVLRFALRNRRR